MVVNNKKIDYNIYLTVFCPPIVSASLITLIILLFFSTYMKNWSTELIQSCMGLILLLLLLTGILLHLISLYTLFLSIFIYLIFSSSIPFLCYRGCIFLKSALDKSSHLLPMSPVAPTPTSPSPQSSPHPPTPMSQSTGLWQQQGIPMENCISQALFEGNSLSYVSLLNTKLNYLVILLTNHLVWAIKT